MSATPGGVSLRTSSERYAHFLIDAEAGGCARTSRLVAAISSLQLFVQRVLIGLEPAQFGGNVLAQEARSQWYWRKNYRVWEANRKVFLFPENFIEPDLRDDKTPLFRTLEEELLQRRVTNAEAEEGFAKYLSGYAEVAGLQVVGAFHDVVRGKELGFVDDEIHVDVLYLVGATSDDPPVHYLRSLGNLLRNVTDAATYPIRYGAWEKLGADIPVKWVSPVVRERRLMLFWVEIATVATSRRVDGESYFDGYEHGFKLKWIEQRPTGSWPAPHNRRSTRASVRTIARGRSGSINDRQVAEFLDRAGDQFRRSADGAEKGPVFCRGRGAEPDLQGRPVDGVSAGVRRVDASRSAAEYVHRLRVALGAGLSGDVGIGPAIGAPAGRDE